MVPQVAPVNVINKWLPHGFDNANLAIFIRCTDMRLEKTGH